jgi:hypothetical protein
MNNFQLTEALVADHVATIHADAQRIRSLRDVHRATFRRRRDRAPRANGD